MIRKICGAALVIGIPFVAGLLRLAEEKRRCAQLSSWIALTEAVVDGVREKSLPLDTIFLTYKDDTPAFREFIQLLEEECQKGTQGGLSRALDRFCLSGTCALTEGDIALISSFVSGLGGEDTEATLLRCESFSRLLRGRHESAVASVKTNGKLIRLLPPAIGALLVILFL